MKIKCVSVGDIKTLKLNKVYTVKILQKQNVSLLDEFARSNYSLRRFETLDGRPLEQYVKETYLDRFRIITNELHKSKRVRYYRLLINNYLISYKNSSDFGKDTVFKINNIFRDRFTKRYNIVNILTNKMIRAVGIDYIKRYFYKIDNEEVGFYIRTQKILKLKNKFGY